jgi:hypothetical protein
VNVTDSSWKAVDFKVKCGHVDHAVAICNNVNLYILLAEFSFILLYAYNANMQMVISHQDNVVNPIRHFKSRMFGVYFMLPRVEVSQGSRRKRFQLFVQLLLF